MTQALLGARRSLEMPSDPTLNRMVFDAGKVPRNFDPCRENNLLSGIGRQKYNLPRMLTQSYG